MRVTGTAIQHVSATGRYCFNGVRSIISTLPQLRPPRLQPTPATGRTATQSISMPNGNLLVSFRNLSEITKIETRTGQVLWRMGGWRNQFTFENSLAQPFARQHGLRAVGSGGLLLFDNLGDPAGSRARRYTYVDATRTARLTATYASEPQIVGQLGGTTQSAGRAHAGFLR